MRKKIVFAAVAILALIACIGSIILFNFNDHTVTVTVTDKERIAQNNDSRYLIYTTMKDTGETLVLENTDNLLRLKETAPCTEKGKKQFDKMCLTQRKTFVFPPARCLL